MMENQNANQSKESSTKKILIICGSVVLVALIAMVCVFMLQGKKNTSNLESMDGNMIMDMSKLSFEDFSMGMKKDLPKETMDEVKRLYEKIIQASKDNKMDKVTELYDELFKLDVYDMETTGDGEVAGVIIMDENGNILEGGEIPDDLKDELTKEGIVP